MNYRHELVRMKSNLYQAAMQKYRSWYERSPEHAAYSPGRIELLGNHTDYNEGFVLSGAINFGMVFLCSGREDRKCRLVAGDLMEEVSFSLDYPVRHPDHSWPNYIIGIAAELYERRILKSGFDALFFGDVPIGGGLSSSAALEMSAAIAITALCDANLDTLELARIGQRAENEYVGAMTGLLDQITALSGRKNGAVLTDFRSLEITSVSVPDDLVILAIDTNVKHSLGESAYNERRRDCENAASRLNELMPSTISSLRDIDVGEFLRYRDDLDPRVARRADHVIRENARVLEAVNRIEASEVGRFGELMYASHESSRHNFENSCAELDWIVDSCKKIEWVYGARLSGGGFGGNAAVLIHRHDAERTVEILDESFYDRFGSRCTARKIELSDGAQAID